MDCVNLLIGNSFDMVKISFGNVYKILRQVLIRLWEQQLLDDDRQIGPACDFWLVCHSKDRQSVVLTIESIHRYSLNPVSKIFLVCNEAVRPHWIPKGVLYIYEGELSITSVVLKALKDSPYKGWILQQILKISGFQYSERFVTIDCDTILLKPHIFFINSSTVLRLAYEHSPHYRTFEKGLHINGGRLFSFTCHMMPYKAELIRSLIARIEYVSGQNWALYICAYAQKHGMSVAVDYDLYARHILSTNEPIVFRPWLNKSLDLANFNCIDRLKETFPKRQSVSFHNSTTC